MNLDLALCPNRKSIVLFLDERNVKGIPKNDYPDPIKKRVAADIAWMQSTFRTAIDQGAVAVLFKLQAGLGWMGSAGGHLYCMSGLSPKWDRAWNVFACGTEGFSASPLC